MSCVAADSRHGAGYDAGMKYQTKYPTGESVRLTYADYLTWPEGRSDELIDGVLYVREPPSPTRLHQEIVGELYYQVRSALEGRPCRVYVAPFDVRLPRSTEPDEQIDTVVQPDILVVCDRKRVDDRGVRGAPDWLVEVLSPSTARRDKTAKLSAYERAGVREIWFVHPTESTLTVYTLEDGRYGHATVLKLKGRTKLTAVPGVTVDWDRILANLL
jgi:Uma2 family endonuclease